MGGGGWDGHGLWSHVMCPLWILFQRLGHDDGFVDRAWRGHSIQLLERFCAVGQNM